MLSSVDPKSLSLSLAVAKGPIGSGGRLELALRLAGIPGKPATGTVAEPSGGFREFALGDSEFKQLCRVVGELEIATREPRVRAVVDTSDGWTEVLLHLAHEAGERTILLRLFVSGFEGEDAVRLHRLFSLLLASAGVRDEGLRVQLTDEVRR
jgi:hypothetical protein